MSKISKSSKQKTRRDRYSPDDSDDSPIYKKYDSKSSHAKPSTRAIEIREDDLQFLLFIPPGSYLMRVKSKTFPKTIHSRELMIKTQSMFKPTITYELAREQIERHVNAHKCKQLREDSAIESVEESNIGCVIQTNDGKMVGFFTIYFAIKDRGEESSIDSIFVDKLCGHPEYSGIGSNALKYIEHAICEPLGVGKLDLESITDSVGFYLKKGFQCNPCKMRLTLKKRG